MAEPARSAAQRKADTLATLRARRGDVWVATAGPRGPHLVPLSFAWHNERVLLCAERTSRTFRNLVEGGGSARLAFGRTRDVVMMDATLVHAIELSEALEVAEVYAAVADWDPREMGPHADSYGYLVLAPTRIQAWRESNEIEGRTLLRDGRWLV